MKISNSFKIWFLASVLILAGVVANARPDLIKDKKLTALPQIKVRFACGDDAAAVPVTVQAAFPLFADSAAYSTIVTIADPAWTENVALTFDDGELAMHFQNSRFSLARMTPDERKAFAASPCAKGTTKSEILHQAAGIDVTYEYALKRECSDWRVKVRLTAPPEKVRDCTIQSRITFVTDAGATPLLRTERITEHDDLFELPSLDL